MSQLSFQLWFSITDSFMEQRKKSLFWTEEWIRGGILLFENLRRSEEDKVSKQIMFLHQFNSVPASHHHVCLVQFTKKMKL